ncbi:hypothetical protein BD769DRAFT_1670531 [Suillus cothurnatus]|nr:hypothetical protein BD769DRAFT_1670531 [Suillus cothurnatus]
MAQVQDNENANMRQIQQVNDGNEVNNIGAAGRSVTTGIAITASAMTLWDYAQTIVQDDREHAQNHPHEARPPTLPSQCRVVTDVS